MARVLVLGAGVMGRVAAHDLLERTENVLVLGDLDPSAAGGLAGARPDRAVTCVVDGEDPASLAAAMADADIVLNATYMRLNLPVTRAAIAAGVNLVDLGSYYPETAAQLALDGEARAAGVRVVPGCGVAPGLTNILARYGADRLDEVESVRIYSYITHPLTTSPGIVYTRFDASSGVSLAHRDGRPVELPSFGEEEEVDFGQPHGRQRVHLVPHPEPLTLPRTLGARNVVFKVGYPEDETRRLRSLIELGLDSVEPFSLAGTAIVPRDFVAAYVARRSEGVRSATVNLKRLIVEGHRGGAPAAWTCDFGVTSVDPPASAVITGAVAAVAVDLVARNGEPGVVPPEAAFDAATFLEALRDRGFEFAEWESLSPG